MGKPKGNRTLERPGRRCYDNIGFKLEERHQGAHTIYLAECGELLRQVSEHSVERSTSVIGSTSLDQLSNC